MGGDVMRGRSAPDDVCGTVSLPQAMSPGLRLGHQTHACISFMSPCVPLTDFVTLVVLLDCRME